MLRAVGLPVLLPLVVYQFWTSGRDAIGRKAGPKGQNCCGSLLPSVLPYLCFLYFIYCQFLEIEFTWSSILQEFFIFVDGSVGKELAWRP